MVCSYHPGSRSVFHPMFKDHTQTLKLYGIFTYIYPKNDPNVGKYSIHAASRIYPVFLDEIQPFFCCLHPAVLVTVHHDSILHFRKRSDQRSSLSPRKASVVLVFPGSIRSIPLLFAFRVFVDFHPRPLLLLLSMSTLD